MFHDIYIHINISIDIYIYVYNATSGILTREIYIYICMQETNNLCHIYCVTWCLREDDQVVQ